MTFAVKWYAHWIPTTRRTYVDALDEGGAEPETVTKLVEAGAEPVEVPACGSPLERLKTVARVPSGGLPEGHRHQFGTISTKVEISGESSTRKDWLPGQ